MLWVGEKGRDVFETWNLSNEESKKLTSCYEKFEAYVKPKSDNSFARYKFHNIIQQEKEPFELTSELTLDKAVDIAQTQEMSNSQLQ